jgi:hypothetical protein
MIVSFKEWLPDQPALGNPGLVECQNAIPLDGTYKSFMPLTGSGTAAPAVIFGAKWSSDPVNGGLYLGTQANLYRTILTTAYSALSSATYNTSSDGYWRFEEYEGLMIATNGVDLPQAHTVGASSNFTSLATSGTTPAAQHVGVVGQFVMLGNLTDSGGTARPYTVRWSSIDQPRNWPTPGSTTAIASQAGEQVLNASFGDVMGIWGNDQYAVIAQQGGLTRATYIGGTAVFQFDEFESGRGVLFPNSAVQIGNRSFYASVAGFCVTDGTQVVNIGDGKVDNYFRSQVSFIYKPQVRAAADFQREIIYWSYCSQTSGSAVPDQLLAYNWNDGRWGRASNTHQCIISPRHKVTAGESPQTIRGWQASRTVGSFSGTPGIAVFETGEAELNESGYARVNAVRPLIDQSSVTVQVATRNDQVSTPTYTTAQAPNSRTGEANFREEARYHRARLNVTGTFNAAQGVQFEAFTSGKV